MPKFEKEFVHFMWDDELEGKEVFYSDSLMMLIGYVNDNNRGLFGAVSYSENDSFPFSGGGANWKFVYFDPHFDLKVAREQGQKIECKRKGDAWEDWDYTPAPAWLEDHEYRIMTEEPEEKPVTNRELSRWLAKGNGEYYEYDRDGWESHRCIEYQYEQDNLPVSNVMVRKWEDSEWHEPSREYMGLEE